ncbi:hypothetical protein TWF281_003645 [Arthrobotrys megalospora]
MKLIFLALLAYGVAAVPIPGAPIMGISSPNSPIPTVPPIDADTRTGDHSRVGNDDPAVETDNSDNIINDIIKRGGLLKNGVLGKDGLVGDVIGKDGLVNGILGNDGLVNDVLGDGVFGKGDVIGGVIGPEGLVKGVVRGKV